MSEDEIRRRMPFSGINYSCTKSSGFLMLSITLLAVLPRIPRILTDDVILLLTITIISQFFFLRITRDPSSEIHRTVTCPLADKINK